MKQRWTKFLLALKNPPLWVKTVSFLTTIITAIASLLLLLIDCEELFFSILSYTLFGVAGISLAYTVYISVLIFPTIKIRTFSTLQKWKFTRLLLENYGFRSVIFAIGSFIMSIAFSVFNAYMGIMNSSIWYGALASYYIALAFLRGGILTYHKGRIRKKNINYKDELQKAKIYRNSGIILLILNVALSSAIAQMIFDSAHFTYVGLTIFAFATYAFYKITMSIINTFRANKQSDLTIKAMSNVNLADATVSILALQTALLITFDEGSVNISLFNTLTGIAVSAFSIGLGIYMIVKANKIIKLLKENNYEQQI